MAISAADVKKLRETTGAGMMDCKKALGETNGDFEAAIDYLRKKGQKVAAKRADRDATEGAVIALSDGAKGVVVYLTSETDFVSKNEDFVKFAKDITGVALANFPDDKETLEGLDLNGKKISEHILEYVGKIGEKIEIKTYERFESDLVVPYIHAGNKIGVLVGLNKASDTISDAGKDIAMQIAALNAVALSAEEVPQETIDREMAIGREKALAEGKPANIVDKIAEGTLRKFYEENTLLKQKFVKDSSKNIEQFVKSIDPDLEITGFKRVSLG